MCQFVLRLVTIIAYPPVVLSSYLQALLFVDFSFPI